MASEEMPYAVCRRNKDHSERWYWQRKGHPLVRLPDDPVERLAEVKRLNGRAEAEDALPRGGVAWCIARYRKSDEYRELKPASLKIYNRWLKFFEGKFGRFQAASVKRHRIMELRDTLKERHGKATVLHAFAVLKLIFGVALDYGYMEVNPAAEPKLSRPKARQAVWAPEQVKAVLAKAEPAEALALRILLYTAQRPSDVVRMTWKQYDGQKITLRQLKTGTLLAVPIHGELKGPLAAENAERKVGLICVRASGRKWTARALSAELRKAMAEAKVTGLQVRDLRRSAVVRLAEAGATIPEIAAITGHSLEDAERIVQIYLPRTYETALQGMQKWEQKAQKV